MELYIGSDNFYNIVTLYDNIAGAVITVGTIVGKLYTIEDQVTQIGDDITFTHVSEGTWRGNVTDTIATGLTAGNFYVLVITITANTYVLVTKVLLEATYRNELKP